MKMKARYSGLVVFVLIFNASLIYLYYSQKRMKILTSDPSSCPVRGDRWIVTVLNDISSASVFQNISRGNWNFIGIGNKTTINHLRDQLRVSNVLLFTEIELKELGFRSVTYLSYGPAAQINIGYLIAILCGAKTIYELDEHILSMHSTDSLNYDINNDKPSSWIAFRSERSAFINMYGIFGQPGFWPRGIPLDEIRSISEDGWSRLRRENHENLKVYVRQKIIDFQQDIDGYTSLARAFSLKTASFDQNRGHVIVEPFTFSPYNSKSTIHEQESFWGLYLPLTFNIGIADILRSLWIQRLLWDIDGHIEFSRSNIGRPGGRRLASSDWETDHLMHYSVKKIVLFLISWSSKASTLRERIEDLLNSMVDVGLLSQLECVMMCAWLDDLEALNYKFFSVNTKTTSLLKKSNQKRAAVCLTGLAECIEEVWSANEAKLRQRLRGDLDVFLFLSSGNKIPSEISKNVYDLRLKQARLYNSTVNILHNDIIDLDPGFKNDCQYNYPFTQPDKIMPIEQERYSQAICFKIVKEYEKKTSTRYELMIRARSDSVFTRLPETFERSGIFYVNQYVIVPDEHHYFGLNDRFAIGPMHLMKYYMSRWYDLAHCYTENVHPESYLSFILGRYYVNVTKDISISLTQVPHSQQQCH